MRQISLLTIFLVFYTSLLFAQHRDSDLAKASYLAEQKKIGYSFSNSFIQTTLKSCHRESYYRADFKIVKGFSFQVGTNSLTEALQIM